MKSNSDERFRLSPEEEKKVEENKGFVFYFVHKMFPRISQSEFDEKAQIGMLGLIKAVKTFDESKAKFSTYASTCIENEILMSIRADQKFSLDVSLNTLVKEKDGSEITIVDVLQDERNSEFYKDIENREKIQSALSIILNQFPSKQMVVMLLNVAGMPQKEIGEQLGFSQSYVSRIVKRYTETLRETVQNYSPKGYHKEHFKVNVDEMINITFPFEDIETFDMCLDGILLKMKEMERVVIFKINRSGKMVTIHLPMERGSFVMLALLVKEISTKFLQSKKD